MRLVTILLALMPIPAMANHEIEDWFEVPLVADQNAQEFGIGLGRHGGRWIRDHEWRQYVGTFDARQKRQQDQSACGGRHADGVRNW